MGICGAGLDGPAVLLQWLNHAHEVICLGMVLDIGLFAVLLLCIVIAAKRGFVLSLLEFAGFFLAGACALWLSGMIAPVLYDRFFAEPVTQAIASQLPELSGAATAAQQAQAVLGGLPDVVVQFAASLGIDTAALTQAIGEADFSGAALAQVLSERIARPVVTVLCRAVLFVVLILVLGVLFRILAAVIDRFCRLPVLRTANAALGGVIGALKGLLVVCVLGVALLLAANLFGTPGSSFYTAVEDSVAVSALRELLPVPGITA